MVLPDTENNTLAAFLAKPRGDRQLRLNISRNTLIAFIVSIVLHLLVLLLVVPKIDLNSSSPSTTIEVSLAPKTKAPEIAPVPVPPQTEAVPEPKVIAQKPNSQPKKSKPRDFSVPKVLTQPQPSPQTLLTPTKPSPTDAPTDMASYIAQQRARRDSAESDAARQNAQAAAADQGLTEEQKRDERIKNNLKSGATSTFAPLRIEPNSASFSFNDKSIYSNGRLKFYEVEASNGEDIRLVIVRRIIEVIRETRNGDFPWESHRLGRTITKSARLEDSAELEDFLMIEFFGSNYKTQ